MTNCGNALQKCCVGHRSQRIRRAAGDSADRLAECGVLQRRAARRRRFARRSWRWTRPPVRLSGASTRRTSATRLSRSHSAPPVPEADAARRSCRRTLQRVTQVVPRRHYRRRLGADCGASPETISRFKSTQGLHFANRVERRDPRSDCRPARLAAFSLPTSAIRRE